MRQIGLDRLGDWNPQLFRELKGRLKSRNLLLAAVISVGIQLIFLLYQWGRLPILDSAHKYCTGSAQGYGRDCVTDALGHTLMDWPLWSLDAFIVLSWIAVVTLPVVGTYLLVSDLDREERRGTLNFLRLTPQSASSLLVGKLLGVPILLYVATLLAVPLHLWLGNGAGISPAAILSFYGAVLASCVCFYSAALLFGLTSVWLGGFQAWLGSGGLLLWLLISIHQNVNHSPTDLFLGFTPALVLAQILPVELLKNAIWYRSSLPSLEWFHWPVSNSLFAALIFTVLNYNFWSFWAWQGLQRCFRNPSTPLLSKLQSYGFTIGFEILVLGLAVQVYQAPEFFPPEGQGHIQQHFLQWLLDQFNTILFFNLVFFLGLIGALLPHRQAVQDWARYRRERSPRQQGVWFRGLIRELLESEASPAVLAIAANLAIASLPLLAWALSWPASVEQDQAIAGLVLNFSMLALYAGLAQLLLLMPNPKRGLWTFGSVSAAVVLPTLVLSLLSLNPDKTAGLWLFSAFPSAAVPMASAHEIVLSWLGQLSIMSFLTMRLTRQVRQIGESASKALLSDRPSDRLGSPRLPHRA